MSIEKREVPYEYLVRFNADGTVRGQHLRNLIQVYDTETNEIYSEKEGPALPVHAAAIPVDVAVGEIAAALAKAEEAERLERIRVTGERDELAAAYTRLAEEKRDVEKQVGKLLSDLDAVRAERAGARRDSD